MITLIPEAKDYSEKALNIYRSLGEVRTFDTLTRDELLLQIKQANIIVLRLAHQIDKAVFESAPELRVIGTPTTGLDHIDLDTAKEKNIPVLSLKGEQKFLESIAATPEHTLALTLASLRNLPQAHSHVLSGGWDRNLFKGREVKGRTFGFYGCGRVAKLLSKYLIGLGGNIIAYDPYVDNATIEAMGIKPVSRQEVFANAQTVYILCPLNQETEGSITYNDFKQMQKGSQLINTARGQILNEPDFVKAMEEGIIATAAVDVAAGERDGEKWMSESPLIAYAQTYDNLIVTPHIAGASYDSMAATEIFIADKVLSFMS